jgi:DNA-binding Lrp family transcriptional regulator
MNESIDDMLLEMGRQLLREGKVNFRSLFDYVPYNVIARKMGISPVRFLNLILEPKNLKVEQIYRLAKILDVDPAKMTKMVTKVVHDEWHVRHGLK